MPAVTYPSRTVCLLATLCALLVACSGNIAAVQGQEQTTVGLAQHPEERHITILHTNDFHGYLQPDLLGRGGSAYIQVYIKQVKDEVGEENVILVDGGDLMHGAGISVRCPEGWGYSVIDIYNLMGYDAVAVGNHEFEHELFEEGTLQARIAQSNFSWVAANILVESTADNPDWVKPYVVKTVGASGNEVVLGIIGLSTDDYVARGSTKGLEFQDPTAAVLRYYDEVRAQSDALVVLAHIGATMNRGYKDLRTVAQELAEAGRPVDLMIGGHRHDKTYEVVGNTVIVEAYKYGHTAGRLDVTIDPATKELRVDSHEIRDIRTSDFAPDPEIAERVAYWAERANILLDPGVLRVLLWGGGGAAITVVTVVCVIRAWRGRSNKRR
jgi:2',3'-cyclic-nucleotide 2'-phosphodiesterase (5'-nucleotidase family)